MIGQVSFAPLRKRSSGSGGLRRRISVLGDGLCGSRYGSTAVEDEMEKNGLILGLICLSGKGRFCV